MQPGFVPARKGLTLVELLIVVAILALLAGLIMAKMGGVLERSQSAVQAANIHDAARMIETYNSIHQTYPSGWDTLIDGSNDTQLYDKLSPGLTGSGGILSSVTLSALTGDKLTSMKLAGISQVNHHDPTVAIPSNSGIISGHLDTPTGSGSGSGGGGGGGGGGGTSSSLSNMKVVILNTASNSVAEVFLREQFNLGRSKQIQPFTFIAFGLGPRSFLVGELLQHAPILESLDPGKTYARAIAIFAVPNTGTTRARFIGVIGPDGRSLPTAMNTYNAPAPRDD